MSSHNEPLALPQASHPLTEIPPMEALYAAFAGGSGDPHHELTLDPAAMDIHDGDEVCERTFTCQVTRIVYLYPEPVWIIICWLWA
jgi:hypothetical protein